MKADTRRLPQLIRGLGQMRVVCLYGDDGEAIRDCARRLVIAEAGSPDDPFRVSECDGDNREAVAAALGSPSLSGGRAVVWVRHANERMLPLVEQALAQDGVLMVVEHGGSTTKSRVRGVVERHPHGCVVACHVQAEATRETIRTELAEFGVQTDEGVVGLLATQADSQACPGRVAGLAAALYAGRGGRLTLADASALAGGASVEGLDAGLYAGLRGEAPGLDSALTALLGDGTAGIAVLRSALLQLQRLRLMAILVTEGRSVAGGRPRDAAAAVLSPGKGCGRCLDALARG